MDSYLSFLSSLKVDLSAVRTEDQAVTADDLLKLRLKASSLKLESTGNFSRHLKGAKFYCKPFEDILKFGSDKIYYLDSPYFLTTEYDVKFSDDDHKAMLDILRDATFRWIFSMQYNQSSRDWCSGKRSRKNQPYIIKDYGAYYRGFYAPFQLEADQKTYVADDAPIEDAKSLYTILFDFDKVKMKWPEMKIKTKEMLVVNFNCLRTIPLHDSAVVLPFNLFLQYADAGTPYQDIVQQAITWRKRNITNNFAGKTVV